MEIFASKIERYLQQEADEWHVKVEDNSIVACYTSDKRFTLSYDEGIEEWEVSGTDINLEMLTNIGKLLGM